MKYFDKEKLKVFTSEICVACGLTKEAGDAVGEVLVETDMTGVHSHGLYALSAYVEKLEANGIDLKAKPEIAAEGPAWAIIDGKNAMPQYVGCFGLEMGIKKAREAGVAYIGMKNSGHYGAPGYYARMAAEAGMVAIACSNCPKNSTVPGTRGETFGNNPFSFAAPRKGHHPIITDMSSSTVAGTKIKRWVDAGNKTIPEGWVVDEKGLPSTDASLYPKLFMSYFSGHKGYCLAMFVEIISAILSGGALINETNVWRVPEALASTSHALILIDTKILGEDFFAEQMDRTADDLLNAPKAEGTERIFMPGDMEWDHFDEMCEKGLDLPEDIEADLAALGEKFGLNLYDCCIN